MVLGVLPAGFFFFFFLGGHLERCGTGIALEGAEVRQMVLSVAAIAH